MHFDMRPIRRENQAYSNKITKDKYGALCGSCGKIENCKAKKAIQRANRKYGSSAEIRTCELFLPVIGFRPPFLGLDQPNFNTFRKGKAWVKRVVPGDEIGLGGLVDADVIGKAIVVAIDHGPLAQMISKHAKLNHMCLTEPCQQTAEAKLTKVLHQSYGKNWAAPQEIFTVITMRLPNESQGSLCHSP